MIDERVKYQPINNLPKSISYSGARVAARPISNVACSIFVQSRGELRVSQVNCASKQQVGKNKGQREYANSKLTVETASFRRRGQVLAFAQTLKDMAHKSPASWISLDPVFNASMRSTSAGEIHVRLIILPADNVRPDRLLFELSSGSIPKLSDLDDLQMKCHRRIKFSNHKHFSRESVDGMPGNRMSRMWVTEQREYASINCGPRCLHIFDQAIAKLGVHHVISQITLVLLAHWCRADASSEKTE